MSASLPMPNQAATTSRSEKSNAWTWDERVDVYNRRNAGETWETIERDYPHRSKHAMEQQCSIMKKQNMLVRETLSPLAGNIAYIDKQQTTPTKSGDRLPKASANALSTPAHAVNGVHEDSDGESSSAQDEANSDSMKTALRRRKGGRKPRLERGDSEESDKPRRRKSAPQQRSNKRLKRPARLHALSEPDEPVEPVSTRPKRQRASGINYNLLQNSGFDQDEESVVTTATDEPKRKSKIIFLRTGPPKRLLNSDLDLNANISPKTVSFNRKFDSNKTPATNDEVSTTRKSARGKKSIGEDLADDDGRPNIFRNDLDTSRKKRRPRMLSGLDIALNDVKTPTMDPAKSSGKRKRSTEAEHEKQPSPVETANHSQDDESAQPEKKKRRAKEKIKEDLGLLANGQPRKRRRRRTRQEILLDSQTPKTVTTRRRGKYQFPYLPGYTGPNPPDMATVLARQDELERRSSASRITGDRASGSSLGSLSDDEESTLQSPSKQADRGTDNTTVNGSMPPTVAAVVQGAAVEQASAIAGALMVSDDTAVSLPIPEIVFLSEDLAKGRENAAKLRASLEAAKDREHVIFEKGRDTEREGWQATLAEERERVSKLEQELVDLRDVFASRLNEERQEHEQALAAQTALSDKALTGLTTEMENDLSTQLQAKQDIIEQMKESERSKAETPSDVSRRPSLPVKLSGTDSSYFSAQAQSLPSPTPTPQNPNIKPLLAAVRNSHIRLAGRLRTTTEAHDALKSSITQLHSDLEEEEITMRGVRNVVKVLVEGIGKVGVELEKTKEESDGVKGGVMGLMDGLEH